ncbi:hypothetical protein DBV15_12385 [Temnothorax longispinosus]|uniref:Endonuclease/exonuclease/phosphatase domain-containing protein n=1 Tax=Temnothorax longispinosus TaxID=300112 RepID=A0A4S2KW34_9HYME|nr:hypothetical protein DBV15_12385 [Temnothorax longispinosus]
MSGFKGAFRRLEDTERAIECLTAETSGLSAELGSMSAKQAALDSILAEIETTDSLQHPRASSLVSSSARPEPVRRHSRTGPIAAGVSSSRLTLRVAHINVRSLLPHFTLVKDLAVYHQLDILAIGETWLRDTIDTKFVDISGFTFVRSDRSTGSRGGGIDLGVPPPGTLVDIVAVSLRLTHRCVAVICAYRPPRSPVSDMHYIETRLSHIACSADKIVCMGDFNIDMLRAGEPNARLLCDIASNLSL